MAELFEECYISSPVDIFTLKERLQLEDLHAQDAANDTEDDFEGLRQKKGWGDKSLENLLASIEARRSLPFPRFLFALGIRHVGELTAKDIAETFESFADLMAHMDVSRTNNTDPGNPFLAFSIMWH